MSKQMCENSCSVPAQPKGSSHFPKIYAFLLVCLVIVTLGCDQSRDVKRISLDKSEKIQIQPQPVSVLKETLKIAVAAMFSPRETVGLYQHILDYLSEKALLPVQLVQRETYAEISTLLKDGDLDAAFVCSGTYVQGHDDFGLELLVAPVVHGKPVYFSYILVARDSPARTLADLRGKSFVFTDPRSNTGRYSPTYLLAKMGEEPDRFFSHVDFTHSHDKSIEAVAKKLVDGAAVDSLVWEYMNTNDPRYTSMTRIISQSAPFAIPPIVVPPGLPSRLKEELRNIFLHMHEDARGKKILSRIMIERFVEISDNAYDTVRNMQHEIDDEE